MTNRKSIIELIAAQLNIRNVIIGLDSPAPNRQSQQDIEPAKSVIHEVKKKSRGSKMILGIFLFVEIESHVIE